MKLQDVFKTRDEVDSLRAPTKEFDHSFVFGEVRYLDVPHDISILGSNSDTLPLRRLCLLLATSAAVSTFVSWGINWQGSPD